MTSSDLFNLVSRNFSLNEPKFSVFEEFLFVVVNSNTTLEKAYKAVEILKNSGIFSLESLNEISDEALKNLLETSGFAKQKAKVLKRLSSEILSEFGDFDSFVNSVDDEWLYARLSPERSDLMLLRVCKKESMPVSVDALKILNFLGYEFGDYFLAKEWFESLAGGFESYKIYYYAIKNFTKTYFKGREISPKGAKILRELL